ncbi:hypothetical protein [Streptomyces sp. NPDC096153]|uniref:hypothetical protein n=1 Tax=Streptomyces sp. NPDC096153 TaxID=3155548 RepID=UPI0033314CD9
MTTRHARKEMPEQLALTIPAQLPPQRVTVRVDEIGVALHATREGHAWWELYRSRMPGRFTTVAVRMPGDLVDVECADQPHARWLCEQLRGYGVPARSLSIQKPPSAP